jgi:hypothetical protein
MSTQVSTSFLNGFGEVHADRVTFNVRKSWFAGSIREDIPAKHITTVRMETKRTVGAGIVLALVGLVLIKSVFGWIALAIAVYLIGCTPSPPASGASCSSIPRSDCA